jgi:hypothetical protein
MVCQGDACLCFVHLMVCLSLIFCSIYDITVFYDVSLVFDDTHSVVSIFFTNMLQFLWFYLLTALFSVKAMLVYLLFTLGYAYVSWCAKVVLVYALFALGYAYISWYSIGSS